jgi:AsmA protein
MTSLFRKRWVRVLALVLGVLLVLGVVLTFVLDGVLTRKAQDQAAALSTRLGRPVTLGSVSTHLLGGLGATVSGLEIGPAAGEEAPLAQVQRVSVRVAALQALFSLGKDIEVRSVEVTAPVLTVIRFADGTTNVERLMDRLERQKPTPPVETPADFSAVRVNHAAVTDGRIRLLDRSSGPGSELSISDVDLTADDLRAGRSLEVTLKAAVLATQQNLALQLHTAPLPSSLVPTPEKVVLHIAPVDIAPLGPFLPRDLRLEAGRLDADWSAELGAAVPGGTGPTQAKGGIHARGLRFANTGSTPIDVLLDTDLSGDADRGNLDIRTLTLTAGNATLTGHGRITGLASDEPKIEGFEVLGRDLDLAVLGRSVPMLARAVGGRIAGPLSLSAHGSGTSLDVALDATRAQVAIPHQLAKATGAPMQLVARLSGAGRSTYRFDGSVDLSGADLRPGRLLNKPPGKPMSLAARGSLQRGPATRLQISAWSLKVLGDAVDGTATVELQGTGKRATTTFAVAARSAHLDADALLLPGEAASTPTVTPGKSSAAAQLDPHRYDGMKGTVSAQVQSLLFHAVPWRNVVLDLAMQDDAVTIKTLSLDVVGGQLRADGTTARLGPAALPFDLKLSARGLDLAQALTFAGKGKPLSGTFDGNLALAGQGTTLGALEKTLKGTVKGTLKNGALEGTDLVTAVAGPLARALPLASGKVPALKRTSLGDVLPVSLTVDKGVARLDKPVEVKTPEATLSLAGGIALSGNLELGGTVGLTPRTVQALTGGKLKPSEDIPVGVQLTGPAWSPHIASVNIQPAVLMLAKLGGASALQSFLGGSKSPAPGSAQPQQGDSTQTESERMQQQAAEEVKKRLEGLFGK